MALFIAATALGLAACGGGDESPGAITPPPVPGPPPPPPPGSRAPELLAFSASDGVPTTGASELYLVEDDGTDLALLSNPASASTAAIGDFKISPNGEWIAFVVQPALFARPLAGGPIAQVSQESTLISQIGDFDWSPDSLRLTFSADTGGAFGEAFEVFAADRNSANMLRISGSIGSPAVVEVRAPQWSPDGRFILQEVADATGGGNFAPQAFALNISDPFLGGSTSTRVVTSGVFINNPRWSPNGVRVCYNINNGVGPRIGTSSVILPAGNSLELGTSGVLDSECRWSADGSLVAYLEQSFNDGPADLEVRIGDASAPAEVVVPLAAVGRTIGDFEWAPGSNARLAYTADAVVAGSLELFVVDRGGTPLRISPPAVANGDVLEFLWSPDASKIAFVADITTDTVRDLYVVNANGSGLQRISDFLSGDEVVAFDWSSDSTRVAFTAGPNAASPNADRLYVATADGASNVLIGAAGFDEVFGVEYAE